MYLSKFTVSTFYNDRLRISTFSMYLYHIPNCSIIVDCLSEFEKWLLHLYKRNKINILLLLIKLYIYNMFFTLYNYCILYIKKWEIVVNSAQNIKVKINLELVSNLSPKNSLQLIQN